MPKGMYSTVASDPPSRSCQESLPGHKPRLPYRTKRAILWSEGPDPLLLKTGSVGEIPNPAPHLAQAFQGSIESADPFEEGPAHTWSLASPCLRSAGPSIPAN